jgi:hypothetical protein
VQPCPSAILFFPPPSPCWHHHFSLALAAAIPFLSRYSRHLSFISALMASFPLSALSSRSPSFASALLAYSTLSAVCFIYRRFILVPGAGSLLVRCFPSAWRRFVLLPSTPSSLSFVAVCYRFAALAFAVVFVFGLSSSTLSFVVLLCAIATALLHLDFTKIVACVRVFFGFTCSASRDGIVWGYFALFILEFGIWNFWSLDFYGLALAGARDVRGVVLSRNPEFRDRACEIRGRSPVRVVTVNLDLLPELQFAVAYQLDPCP